MDERLFEPEQVKPGKGPSRSHRLVKHFVDYAKQANGVSPPRRVVGHLGKEIDALVKEGHPDDLILDALEIMVDKGLDASSLPSCVFTAQSQNREGLSRSDRALLRLFLKDIAPVSWPTGARWVHSGAAGAFVYDPLGVDRPPYDVPWTRPSKHEIVAALKRRSRISA